MLDRGVFMDCTLHGVFTANSRLAKVMSVKFATWLRVCETSKQTVNLSVHQDGGHPITGIPEILDTETSIAES
jgi:hypothetical protein